MRNVLLDLFNIIVTLKSSLLFLGGCSFVSRAILCHDLEVKVLEG